MQMQQGITKYLAVISLQALLKQQQDQTTVAAMVVESKLSAAAMPLF
jgi:hypothetical protein